MTKLFQEVLPIGFDAGRLGSDEDGVLAGTSQLFSPHGKTLASDRRQVVINHQPVIGAGVGVKDKTEIAPVLAVRQLTAPERSVSAGMAFGDKFDGNGQALATG
jgi:hypothetical protein